MGSIQGNFLTRGGHLAADRGRLTLALYLTGSEVIRIIDKWKRTTTEYFWNGGAGAQSKRERGDGALTVCEAFATLVVTNQLIFLER
jgi:hypothetical protein